MTSSGKDKPIVDKPIICKRCGRATKNHEEVDTWPWLRYESPEEEFEADLCFECGTKLRAWLRLPKEERCSKS